MGRPRTTRKPRIAVFSGPQATVLRIAPLVTGNDARRRWGLPPLLDEWGEPLRFDILRPQRLAKPVTVYVEQFSAHPLERDAADLYGPPDGFLDADGQFQVERRAAEDIAVYEIQLRPEDGLLPLPYVAVQRDGSAWEEDAVRPRSSPEESRQPFYPDASRLFEEIDRLGVDVRGVGSVLSSRASFDFYRVLPSAGYSHGLRADERTDVGDSDIQVEKIWSDYFPYWPPHLRREPPRRALAQITNRIQTAMSSGDYRGGLWLEGSPHVEETSYWLNLLLDTTAPLVACSSVDWPHGVLSASGDRHILDSVRYVTSGVWADDQGRDRIGVVVIQAGQIYTAREVQKVDARAGGYSAAGGHGGIVGSMVEPGPPALTFLPVRRHTHRSDVRLTQLPSSVPGLRGTPVPVKNDRGELLEEALPHVSIVKQGRFSADDATSEPASEVEILARIQRNLDAMPLAGFVVEGTAPYGTSNSSADAALRLATLKGMPVVRTARGNAEGFVRRERVRPDIGGGNLTATKARLLLTACLLKFGALPAVADPERPSDHEMQAIERQLTQFQAIFDSH